MFIRGTLTFLGFAISMNGALASAGDPATGIPHAPARTFQYSNMPVLGDTPVTLPSDAIMPDNCRPLIVTPARNNWQMRRRTNSPDVMRLNEPEPTRGCDGKAGRRLTI